MIIRVKLKPGKMKLLYRIFQILPVYEFFPIDLLSFSVPSSIMELSLLNCYQTEVALLFSTMN